MGGKDEGCRGQMSTLPLGFAAGLASRQPYLLPPQPGHGFYYSCLSFGNVFAPFFATSLPLDFKGEEELWGVENK